jgi:hypothetical protein
LTPLTIIGYLFATAVTVSCVLYLRSGSLKADISVFRGRSWKNWVEILAGDLAAISALYLCYLAVSMAKAGSFFAQVLNFSWLQLLATKGEKAVGMNQMLAGAQIPWLGIPFVILLLVNLPRLAAAEEESYRLGTRDWKHAFPRSLSFGLMHMVVGVPLWCGLALSIPGLWFTLQYFRGGVSRSTMAHALYNMILASVLLVFVVYANIEEAETSQRANSKHRAEKTLRSNVNR